MFFPSKEFPTAPLEIALANLGVTCRQLPNLSVTDDDAGRAQQANGLSGFTLKIAALILSQFQEASLLGLRLHALKSRGISH